MEAAESAVSLDAVNPVDGDPPAWAEVSSSVIKILTGLADSCRPGRSYVMLSPGSAPFKEAFTIMGAFVGDS